MKVCCFYTKILKFPELYIFNNEKEFPEEQHIENNRKNKKLGTLADLDDDEIPEDEKPLVDIILQNYTETTDIMSERWIKYLDRTKGLEQEAQTIFKNQKLEICSSLGERPFSKAFHNIRFIIDKERLARLAAFNERDCVAFLNPGDFNQALRTSLSTNLRLLFLVLVTSGKLHTLK